MDHEIVKVHSAMSGPEAVVIMSILNDANIRYEWKNDACFAPYGLNCYDTSLGPIDFYIHRDDLPVARKLLKPLNDAGEDL